VISIPRTPRRFEYEMLVWRAATILVIICALFFPSIWRVAATVYLAVVSNYALDLTAAGNVEAAAARVAAEASRDAA
jgi:hypothetical protein